MTAKEQRTLWKEFRRRTAMKNGITLLTPEQECPEDCCGSCPACQAEGRWLDSELNRKAAAGAALVVFGVDMPALTPSVIPAETPAPAASSGSMLDMTLEELGLSLRTRVSLDGHGVTSLRQLLDMTPSDCRKVRNMTQEGLDEIEFQLGMLGLALKKED
ncbi:MAG: hypothetical protein E7446_04480 [Ruminococcaceae bacterium]|nr:hypothetical protein [Oscillospiraceae bacterium]